MIPVENAAPAPEGGKVGFTRCEAVGFGLVLAGLVFVLHFHLLAALFAGCLVHELVHLLAEHAPVQSRGRRKVIVIGVLTTVVVGGLVAAGLGLIAFARGPAMAEVIARSAEVLDQVRDALPERWAAYVPDGLDELRERGAELLRAHAAELQLAGRSAGLMVVHLLIGMIVGAMVSLREASRGFAGGPLAATLHRTLAAFGAAFRNVIFAQVRISAINTTMTAIYLAAILPLFGVQLPLLKTLIAFTFVIGLIPVAGNLISNTAIVLVALTHHPVTAAASLGYLIFIHKLEYFLNARIIGGRVHAHAWELLVAMLAFESVWGIGGLVAAPVVYAFVKSELVRVRLI
ncbi:AI-2E family transporter [Derxia gummosa]|uniref:AI-2E family transporter n=1 Tax=Derxia gummosa DSM 723 TaxID=1121388 RepID=A0A8B6XBG3_9BURK|nr:AI-2E family transporter [Derxia gummosa]